MDRKKGMGFWPFVLIAIAVMLIFSEDMLLMSSETYTYPQFIQDIENREKDMEQIVIVPNSEVPTGSIEILWTDETKTQCNVTDVNEVIEILKEAEVTNWQVSQMQKESWLERHGGSLMIAGVIFATPWPRMLWEKVRKHWVADIFILALFWVVVYYIATAAQDPFLYFQY